MKEQHSTLIDMVLTSRDHPLQVNVIAQDDGTFKVYPEIGGTADLDRPASYFNSEQAAIVAARVEMIELIEAYES